MKQIRDLKINYSFLSGLILGGALVFTVLSYGEFTFLRPHTEIKAGGLNLIFKGDKFTYSQCENKFTANLEQYNGRYINEVGLFLLQNNYEYNPEVSSARYNDLRDFSAQQLCMAISHEHADNLARCEPAQVIEFEDALLHLKNLRLVRTSKYVKDNITRYRLSEWGKVVYSRRARGKYEQRARLDLRYKQDGIFDLLRKNPE